MDKYNSTVTGYFTQVEVSQGTFNRNSPEFMMISFQGNSIRDGAKIKHRLSFCEQVGFERARRKVGVVGDGGRRIDKIDGGAGCVVEFLRE